MCGIPGVFGKLKNNESQFETMLQVMEHRGPDGNGTITKDGVFLGHQRLSIVDVEGGSQPLESSDGNTHLVCNGEIYNYQNLKRHEEHNNVR